MGCKRQFVSLLRIERSPSFVGQPIEVWPLPVRLVVWGAMVEGLGDLRIEGPLTPIRALEGHLHELVCVIGFRRRFVELERNPYLCCILRHKGGGFDHAWADFAGIE